jgi:cellulose synthase/poly-beta-1,6-N-acetylglucosamine synthase-like glycosyltransferase
MGTFATAIFVLSAAFCLYVVAGYPCILWLLSRRPRPVHRKAAWKSVSVILPVRNGERWIARKLDTLRALDYPPDLLEIVVVSDGSTDRTEQIVREYGLLRGLRLFCIPASGKAEALNTAIAHAGGEILFLTDVRQALEPKSLRRLVECFADPSVGVASGELIILEGASLAETNVGLYWKYEKWIRKRQSAVDSVPGATGCIYAMRSELAVPLPPGTLADDMYLPLSALLRGYRIILDERARAYDFPTALENEFHRKVRTLAGVYQVTRFLPALVGPRNRIWFHFISHKLARLGLPFAMIAAAVSAVWLPGRWAPAALGVQAAFYLLAAIDLSVPDRVGLKRVTSPVRTFVVLMAAAAFAVSVFFVPEGRLWKQSGGPR